MDRINRERILNKTHYGLNIYSHILRLYYPDDVVLCLTERDCGLSRNPFNANKETLHIFIAKSDPANVTSKELACHMDSENAISAGNAFDFAEQHYRQQGDELLQTLNKELNLNLGQKSIFYHNNSSTSYDSFSSLKSPSGDIGVFSFFKAPITNIIPHSQTNLRQVYNAIKGNYYKERTDKLRSLITPLPFGEGLGERSGIETARKFKSTHFDYCTFSGTFTTRNDKALIKHSGLLCIDFDHLNNVEILFNRLLQDEYFDTQLLFRSPSGDGLKWVISLPAPLCTNSPQGQGVRREGVHGYYFTAIANYILQTYGTDIAPTYPDWRDLGFALADGLGESGRSYYHRLSRFYPKYNPTETDKQYDNCLNAHGHGITIKTLYHLAKQANINISQKVLNNQGNHNNQKIIVQTISPFPQIPIVGKWGI